MYEYFTGVAGGVRVAMAPLGWYSHANAYLKQLRRGKGSDYCGLQLNMYIAIRGNQIQSFRDNSVW